MKKSNFPFLVIIFLIIFSAIQCNKNDDIEKIPEVDPTQSFFKETIKTEKIGSAGGTIDLGNGVKVSIPNHALSSETHITVENANPFVFEEKPRFDGDGMYVSSVVICKPSGLTFSVPFKISIPYYSELIPSGYSINDFIVLGSNGSSWDTLAFNVNQSNKIVEAEANHFSEFKVLLNNINEGNMSLTDAVVGINGSNNNITISYRLYLQGNTFWELGFLAKSKREQLYQEYWHEIGFYRKSIGIDEFLGAKQIFWGLTKTKEGEALKVIKGSRAEDKELYDYDNFPNSARLSKDRQIFDLFKGGELNKTYAATNEVSFGKDKNVKEIRFRDIGKIENFKASMERLSADNEKFNIDIASTENLNIDDGYYFKIRVQGYGKVENDYVYYKSTVFKLSDLTTENGLNLIENQKPVIDFISPTNNSSYSKYELIKFKCKATDIEDGELPDNQVIWTIATPTEVLHLMNGTETILPEGTYSVMVVAADSDGNETQAFINITINPDNNDPTVQVGTELFQYKGDVKISFMVNDLDMNKNDFYPVIQLSRNEYKKITIKSIEKGEYDGNYFRNVPVGTNSFIWDSKADYPNVYDKVTVSMGWKYGGGQKKVSNDETFFINNTDKKIPLVKTLEADNFTSTSARLNAEVITDGGGTILERGFYWSDESNPYPGTGDNVVKVSGSTGTYNKTITGLLPEKKYYFVAYVQGSEKAMLGDYFSFTTPKPEGEAPVADFTASRTSIKKGESIQFTDISTNNPTSWLWTFSDGQTSNLQNPTKQFNTVGTISVTLKASNSFSNDTKTITNYITVSETGTAPVANFRVTYRNPSKGQNIQFYDESTNSPTSWLWNFGDGTTSSSKNPSKTYNSTGNFTVSLKASNSFGNDTKTITNYITVSGAGTAPVADFEASKTSIQKGESIQFTDKSTNNPTKWVWTFSDGQTSTLQNPYKQFNSVGTISVTLKASNSYGDNTKTIYITVSETGSAPEAWFTVSEASVNTGESIQFTDNSKNNPTSWLWDFGDGKTSTEQNPKHSYSSEGGYYISLKATNDYGTGNSVQTMRINVAGDSDETTGTFTDARDDKKYKWIKIGTQIWMAENLAFKTSSGSWAYDNNESNVSTYGRLYNWATAKNACPSDWHLPSDGEWKELERELGMSEANTDKTGWRGDIYNHGGKLKETGTVHWKSPNTVASNTSEFTALPGGELNNNGYFSDLRNDAYFWSESAANSESAWYRQLENNSGDIYRGSIFKDSGMSVRCIKN